MGKQITELALKTGALEADEYFISQKTGQTAQRRAATDLLQAASTTASSVSFLPAGTIAATTVQAALVEVDSEKTPTSRTISTAAGLTGGGDLSANRTLAFDLSGLSTLTSVDGAADMLLIYDNSAATHLKVAPNSLPAGSGTRFRIGVSITTPTADTDYLDLGALFGYTINSLTHRTNTGTATVAIKINGSVVTNLSAVSMTTTLTATNATAGNTVVVGNNVEYTTSAISSVGRLWLWLNCTRT